MTNIRGTAFVPLQIAHLAKGRFSRLCGRSYGPCEMELGQKSRIHSSHLAGSWLSQMECLWKVSKGHKLVLEDSNRSDCRGHSWQNFQTLIRREGLVLSSNVQRVKMTLQNS